MVAFGISKCDEQHTFAWALNGSRQPRSDADAQAQASDYYIQVRSGRILARITKAARDAGLWAKLKIALCSWVSRSAAILLGDSNSTAIAPIV